MESNQDLYLYVGTDHGLIILKCMFYVYLYHINGIKIGKLPDCLRTKF